MLRRNFFSLIPFSLGFLVKKQVEEVVTAKFGNEVYYIKDGYIYRIDKVDQSSSIPSTWPLRRWYDKEGRLHRIDGPAYETQNCIRFYKNGKLHREDGPAIVHVNGHNGHNETWIDGKRISEYVDQI